MVMSRRNSLPPLSEMTAVQALRQYSVSCANGTLRQKHLCKVRNNSPRAPLVRLAAAPRGGGRADAGSGL